QKEHRDGPQRYELESPLGQRVVARPLAGAPAANGPRADVGTQGNENRTAFRVPDGLVVNKALLLFDVVEDSLELHLVRWAGCCCGVDNNINSPTAGKMHFFGTKTELAAFVGAGHRSLTAGRSEERAERMATDGRAQTECSGCLCW